MKKILGKDLLGEEFELENYCFIHDNTKIHNPEVLIIPFYSFGLGSKLNFTENVSSIYVESSGIALSTEMNISTEIDESPSYMIREGGAIVTNFYEKEGKIIIEAEENTRKEEKKGFLDKIIKKIDFSDSLNEKVFIDMLSHVFTESQLKHFLEVDDIEILLFDGAMYLKCEDKAYRL